MSENVTKPVQKKLEFGLTRNYGAATVHFQISAIVEVCSMSEQQTEMEKLIAQVNFHHAEYARDHMHKLPAPPDSGNDKNWKSPDAYTEYLPVTEATLTIDNGKRYVKLKGGKYHKHGVPIWDEVLSKTDILERMGTATRLDMSGYTMVVNTSGKPKVVEVIPPNGA